MGQNVDQAADEARSSAPWHQYAMLVHRGATTGWKFVNAPDDEAALRVAVAEVPQAGGSVVVYRRVKMVERAPGRVAVRD